MTDIQLAWRTNDLLVARDRRPTTNAQKWYNISANNSGNWLRYYKIIRNEQQVNRRTCHWGCYFAQPEIKEAIFFKRQQKTCNLQDCKGVNLSIHPHWAFLTFYIQLLIIGILLFWLEKALWIIWPYHVNYHILENKTFATYVGHVM